MKKIFKITKDSGGEKGEMIYSGRELARGYRFKIIDKKARVNLREKQLKQQVMI